MYVDCQTGQRIVTQEEKEKSAQRIRQETQQKAAQQARATEAEKKRLEKAIEKRKQQLKKERQKQLAKQTQVPQQVQINGETYYLSAKPGGSSFAGIQSHDWMISAYGGFGTYSSGETQYDSVNIAANKMTFWSAGASGLFFPSCYVGLGLGIETDQFARGKKEHFSSYSSGGGWSHYEYGDGESRISLEKLMFLGRLNLNPAHGARLYVPFGGGYGRVKETQKIAIHVSNWPGTSYSWKDEKHYAKSTLIYFAGLGLEFDLTEYVSLGLEGRYTRFSYRSSTFAYVNGLAKVNVKF